MNRRVFLAGGLVLVGFVRRAWAQFANPSAPGHPNAAAALGTPPVRYAPLTRPVKIPVEAVVTPWRPVPFTAESSLPRRSPAIAKTNEGGRRVLISGVLFRTNTQLSALCVTCPHEQCQVDLVTDEERLARMVGQKGTHPLFECGCHFSVFDAADEGARLSGESPRGLYRFRIAGVRDGIVEIVEIEEAALAAV